MFKSTHRTVHTVRRALALACALIALSATTATAQPQHSAGPPADTSTPTTIVQVTSPNGFDWGDAGIGAAAGLAVSLIALAGFRARQHGSRRSARAIS